MPEEQEVQEQSGEFDEAFAERSKAMEAERRDGSEYAEDAPGGVGAEGAQANDDGDAFDKSFHDAAASAAASRGDANDVDLAEKLAALEAETERLRQSERSQRGRVSALTKKLVELQQQKAASTSEEPPDTAAAGGEQASGAADDSDDWEEFKREFPEMAAIVDKRIAKVDQKFESVKSEIDRVATTADTIAEKEILAYKETQFDILRDAHPDFEQIKSSPEWQRFKAGADEETIAKIKSKHAEDAIAVLDAFKEQVGWGSRQITGRGKSDVELVNERRSAALRHSAGISSKKVGHTPRKEPASDDDFDAAFLDAVQKKEKQRSFLR